MRGLVTFILLAVAYVALNIIFAAINFIGDHYSNILGPLFLVGLVAALAVFIGKKGN